MMKIPKRSLFIFTLLAILLLCFSATAAEVETVINNDDSGDGSLRWALETVDNGGTICFDVTGVISLDSELEISRDVKIEGPGSELLTISGQEKTRIITIYNINTPKVIISGLSLINGAPLDGFTSGGFGIETYGGELSLVDCVIRDNKSYQWGGAINSANTNLSFDRCKIINNNTIYKSDGGALYISNGNLTMEDCEVTANSSLGNLSGPYARGGAIYMQNLDSAEIINCSFKNNSGKDGGTLYATGVNSLTINSTAFSENSASKIGGALYITNNTNLSIINNIFYGNTIPGTADKWGGAIYSENSNVNIKNSTLYDNTASDGGCIYLNSGIMAILNSTIISNDAENHAGGIYNNGTSTLSLSNTTISLNDMDGSCHGSGIYTTGDLSLKNTIIAGNSSKDIGTNDLSGNNISSYGYNLIGFSYYAGGDPSEIYPWDDTDIIIPDITSADIFVTEGLALNDGPSVGAPDATEPMLTLALKENSPAIDTASSTDIDGNVVSTDQRGKPRPSPEGGSFDIGAFELQQEPIETFTITTTHTEGGSITTDSDAENSASNYFIPAGESITFEITSDNGYYISQINVDEEPYYTHLSFQKVITEDTYTFDNVSEDHTLSATFAAEDDPVDPVDPDEPNLEGGTCNVGAFTPLAGLLVLPLLFLFKK